MKVAIAFAPALRLPACSRQTTAQFWRLAGLLLIVGIPVLFWTSALALFGHALGFEIGSGMLVAASLTVGMSCLIAASLLAAAGSNDT
jgi:hypothetical protein